MREGYSVTVFKNGEQLVTIERSMLSGQDPLSDDDKSAIRNAGEHLIAFAGPEHVTCFGCGGENGQHFDCPIYQPNSK